ncbi:hypothetical protein [Absidia glauca]|uniref:Uncharacterized protein n=1 Tax=Absidia glauca TaxID=4829 RepID=A0A168KM53_ABSGL|nr:hypothetical protein [Absidia glauca]
MSIISPHTHNYHPNSIPSMEHDDSCSDTDTVLYTPTSSTTTMYYHPTWSSSPTFEESINPLSHRPFSSPPLASKSKQAINPIDTQLTCARRVSSPPMKTEDDIFHIPGPLSPTSPSVDHYETTIRRMSQHIDDFFQSRQQEKCAIPLKESPTDSGPSSVVTSGAMITMVHQFRDTHTCNDDPEHQEKQQQLCDAMLSWLQQQPSSEAQQQQQQLEDERQKNARLITCINRLAQNHHSTKHAYRKERSKARRQEQTIKQLNKERQARQEAEEILDSVRVEMETMMDELDTAKQQLFIAQQDAQHVRQQWEDIIQEKHQYHHMSNGNDEDIDPWALLALQQEDWEQRIKTLTTEKLRISNSATEAQALLKKEVEESQKLRQRLLKTERKAAEYDLKLVVLKSQQSKNMPEEKDEVIAALQRELVEKNSALVRWDKKWQQETKQRQHQQAAQHQSHLTDYQTWKDEYKQECQKEQDLTFLRITRETRALEARLDDLALENERLEAGLAEHQQKWHCMEKQARSRETHWAARQVDWERAEKESKALVLSLEQKVIGLETEAVRLYGKNIALANQLGECD